MNEGEGEDIYQNTNCRVSVGANFCYFGVIEKRMIMMKRKTGMIRFNIETKFN